MKKWMTIFCLLIVNFTCADSIRWNQGVIVLHSNAVLSGNIRVEASHNIVLLQQGTRVEVYPAHRVKSVYYHDADANINRKFVSIPEKDVSRHAIYEVVVFGDVMVLRKLAGIFSDSNDNATGYLYYLFHEQSLIELRRFSSELYPDLVRSSPMLPDFVHTNKLRTGSPADIIRIVLHYNSLLHHPDTGFTSVRF